MRKYTDENGIRWYETPEGKFPSVTTILRETRKKKDQDRLRKWQHKIDQVGGKGSAKTEREKAAERGTLIHKQIEQFLKGELFNLPDNEYFASAIPHLKLLRSRWYKSEHPIYHPDGYAGTLDLYAEWEEAPCIIDFTTSKRHSRRKWIEEKLIQCTAYGIAHNWLYDTEIKKAVCIALSPNRCQVFDQKIDDLEQQWNERLEKFYRDIRGEES